MQPFLVLVDWSYFFMISTGRFTIELRKLVHYRHNTCSICSQRLPRDLPAYAGYGLLGNPIYTGDCCKHNVAELASHIYWWWADYPRPDRETIIWRYMDFAKLVAMFKDRSLYFARGDKLGDPYEGARGLASREGEWRDYCIGFFRNAIVTVPGNNAPIPEEEIASRAKQLYDEFVVTSQRDRLQNFVSCWHSNHVESEAQWRLYAPSLPTGVAVRTKFGKLDDSLDQRFDVRGGFVQYVDYSKAFAGTYDKLFWKRSSLSHEAEVRIVHQQGQLSEPEIFGVSVPMDLNNAFEAIIVSPFAPDWFVDVVRETARKFEVSIEIEKSQLLSDPFF
jgi:hypothetical protein